MNLLMMMRNSEVSFKIYPPLMTISSLLYYLGKACAKHVFTSICFFFFNERLQACLMSGFSSHLENISLHVDILMRYFMILAV